ncbi:sulfite exporter TauE/SafE family protein [Methanococcoides sp. SA1]|nr:sulfite exporter TauE/SafE family protein [Methanococcoides sp. SA1]
MIFEILILLVAGIGAGIVTGFVGASAVMVVAPLLILFLDMDAYIAIGLSLGVDVFASAFASFTYYKKGNLEFRKSLVVLLPALFAVLVGSYFSQFFESRSLAWITGLAIFGIGVSFLFRKSRSEFKDECRKDVVLSILAGIFVGLIAGTFGAGGGIMILSVLVLLLGYRVHVAIGTSVLMMVFIALFGSVGHYYYEVFDLWYLFVAGFGGIVGAVTASLVANTLREKVLFRVIGVILVLLGGSLFVSEVFL